MWIVFLLRQGAEDFVQSSSIPCTDCASIIRLTKLNKPNKFDL